MAPIRSDQAIATQLGFSALITDGTLYPMLPSKTIELMDQERAARLMAVDCWESGGPEFLFPLMIHTGFAGCFAIVIWVALWSAAGRKIQPPASRLRRIALSGPLAFASVMALIQGVRGIHDPQTLLIQVLAYVPIIASVAATSILMHRRAVNGNWPPVRALPTLVRWSLPVTTVLYVLTAFAALVAQVALGGSC
jgi:hypothetical protein